MQLVVGLGNPGNRYVMSRHNLGFMVVDALARSAGVAFRKETRFGGDLAKVQIDGHSAYLLKPTTYMNNSGSAVRKVVDYYKLDPQQVLVVVDDVAIPFLAMRLREKGSAGGHNGLKSIQQHLGTQEYPRLRLGIGEGGKELSDYVLDDFSAKERQQLPEAIVSAVVIVQQLLAEPIVDVMNRVNQKSETSREAGQEN
jgi:PTH1 family peptidyl-tRNA hydrolase